MLDTLIPVLMAMMFSAAKGADTAGLGERSSDLSTEEYESLICGHLGFIQDGHLSLGRTRLCEFYSLFWNPEYEFRRDDAGFLIAASDGIRRAASIEGDDPCSYLKPSIDEAGTSYMSQVLCAQDLTRDSRST